METSNIKITPKWSKSKNEIWNEMFADIEDVKIVKVPSNTKRLILSWCAAAVLALFVSASSFTYFYTRTEISVRGSHLAITLPDGSSVEMNAESQISYKPYWWSISRDVELQGEAYFKVEPGSQFTVKSKQNQVRVLGTSFNIFARADKYIVNCITGKVEVTANDEEAILSPNMQASLRDNEFNVTNNAYAQQSIDWMDDKFSFIGTPLSEVIAEIERQYDIHITTSSKLNYLYTGNFSKDRMPEEVLEIIGKPFDIEFNVEFNVELTTEFKTEQ